MGQRPRRRKIEVKEKKNIQIKALILTLKLFGAIPIINVLVYTFQWHFPLMRIFYLIYFSYSFFASSNHRWLVICSLFLPECVCVCVCMSTIDMLPNTLSINI